MQTIKQFIAWLYPKKTMDIQTIKKFIADNHPKTEAYHSKSKASKAFWTNFALEMTTAFQGKNYPRVYELIDIWSQYYYILVPEEVRGSYDPWETVFKGLSWRYFRMDWENTLEMFFKSILGSPDPKKFELYTFVDDLLHGKVIVCDGFQYNSWSDICSQLREDPMVPYPFWRKFFRDVEWQESTVEEFQIVEGIVDCQTLLKAIQDSYKYEDVRIHIFIFFTLIRDAKYVDEFDEIPWFSSPEIQALTYTLNNISDKNSWSSESLKTQLATCSLLEELVNYEETIIDLMKNL